MAAIIYASTFLFLFKTVNFRQRLPRGMIDEQFSPRNGNVNVNQLNFVSDLQLLIEHSFLFVFSSRIINEYYKHLSTIERSSI